MLDNNPTTVRRIEKTAFGVPTFDTKEELYRLIEEGIEAGKAGRTRPYRDVIADIRKKINEISK